MPRRTPNPTTATPIAWPHMHFESIEELSLVRAFTLQREAIERTLETMRHIEPSKKSIRWMQQKVDYYSKNTDRYSMRPEHLARQLHRIDDASLGLCRAYAAIQSAEDEHTPARKPGPSDTDVTALREAVASLESAWTAHLIPAWLVALSYLPEPQRQDWLEWFKETMMQGVFRTIACADTAVRRRSDVNRRGYPYNAVDVALRVVRMMFDFACNLALDPTLGRDAPEILKTKTQWARGTVREAQRELEEHRSKIVESAVRATRPKVLLAFGESIGTVDPAVREELLRRPLAGENFRAERLRGI